MTRAAALPLVTLAAILSFGATFSSGNAQTLVPLHVRSFTLATDKQSVRVGESFHLIVKIHVDEVLTQLDQTTLPNLYGFESEGDERVCNGSTKGGTDCTETMELVPSIAGDRTIGPVTLDAIDASSGRPSRYGTNIVTIHVAPDPLAWIAPTFSTMFDVFATALRVLLALAAIVLAVLVLRWLFSRTRKPASEMFVAAPPAAPPSYAPPPYAPPLDPFEARYRAALAQLHAQPTRQSVVALRALVRERCGAGERETLGDLLRRDAAHGDAALIGALRAIERAAFVEDANLGAAIVAAYPDLERLAGSPA